MTLSLKVYFSNLEVKGIKAAQVTEWTDPGSLPQNEMNEMKELVNCNSSRRHLLTS